MKKNKFPLLRESEWCKLAGWPTQIHHHCSTLLTDSCQVLWWNIFFAKLWIFYYVMLLVLPYQWPTFWILKAWNGHFSLSAAFDIRAQDSCLCFCLNAFWLVRLVWRCSPLRWLIFAVFKPRVVKNTGVISQDTYFSDICQIARAFMPDIQKTKVLTSHLTNLRTADGGTGTCTELLCGSNSVLWGSGYTRLGLLSASDWSDEADSAFQLFLLSAVYH